MTEIQTPKDTLEISPPSARGQHSTWAERGVGKGWQFRFFYLWIRLLGKRPAYHISYIVTFWYVLLYARIRQRAGYYLDRRFTSPRGCLRRFWEAYHLIRSFGTTLVDIAAFGILGKKSLAAFSPNHDRLMQLCDDQRGFVMLHAHVGCWQVGLSALGHLRKRVSLVMIPDPRGQELLDRYSVSVIDPRRGFEGVVEMTQALFRGEVVGMMGDRTFGDDQNTVKVRFLGSDIVVPVAPYRLASATGVPVVVLMAPKTGYRSYELRLVKEIVVPPGLGRNPQRYTKYAQEFADALEAFVHEYPWQFFNFFDLWRDAAANHADPKSGL